MGSSLLSDKLQYRFRDRSLIEEALRHSSYVNEQGEGALRDNERLEFLGDAVLNLIAGHLLMQQFPDMKEGDLSRMRANLVNETQLAGVARAIDLGIFLKLGKGELLSNGREKNSILANTFEAVIAAVFLDGGYDAAHRFVETHLAPLLAELHPLHAPQDFKSQLQELVQQGNQTQMPAYTVTAETGPDHDKTFCVQLEVLSLKTLGRGKSKKLAEQDAARQALDTLLNKRP